MKKNEFTSIINKSKEELKKDLGLYQEKLRQLKFDLASGKVKNIKEIKTVKKSIAQLFTLINKARDNY
ncbi:MAG: 50S ribosomal protein L29 [Patescibacteria group bacterium]|mgnify:CR=1 FL=1